MSSSATRLGPIIRALSSVTDPWVEHAVQHVRQQVAGDDKQSGEKRHAHDCRVVVLQGALEGELADARPPKDDLDHEAAAHQAWQLEADERDEGDERVAQAV